MTRDEKRAEARRMRDEGVSLQTIADRLNVGKTTVLRWTDDEANARHLAAARAYKERCRGACVDCGAPTNACRGRGNASERCTQCAPKRSRDLTRRWILDSIGEWAALFDEPPTAIDWNQAMARSHKRWDLVARYEATGRPWPNPNTVRDNFGSWNAALEEAGQSPCPRGFRRDQEAHTAKVQATYALKRQARWDLIADLYVTGMPLARIGAALDITAGAVAWNVRAMRRAGWDLPDRRRGRKQVAA